MPDQIERLALEALSACGATPANAGPVARATMRAEARRHRPMVLDQSSSAVARVTLNAALAEGGPLPEGWAHDQAGRPTTDPKAARVGSMAPAGGARGAGVALMVEIFAAALTGANLSFEMQDYGVGDGPPMNIGQFFFAIDPARIAPGFAERAERLFAAILEQDGARLPGDRRLAERQRAGKSGVEVDAALIDHIKSLGGIR